MKKMLACSASIILFIELLDTTILYASCIPMSRDFGVSVSMMSLSMISYLVGTCIFIPIVSWLSNQYNKINIIITTLIAFSLFSLLCSMSSEIYIFSLFRFLQGIAISISASMIILTLLSVCKGHEIVKIIASINIPALLGAAVGPFAGAIFSYYVSWRIAFLINLPICIFIVLTLMRLKSNPLFCIRSELPNKAFDILGFIFLSTSLILISIGFEELSNSSNLIYCILIFIGIACGLLYVIIWKQRQKQYPLGNKMILDLKVFSNTNYLFGTFVNILSRSAMCGVPILFSIVLQQFYGFSIIKAGLYLAIIAGSGIIAKFFSTLIEKIGVRQSIMLSVILTSISIDSFSQLQFWINNHCLWIPCCLFGFSMSLLYTSMNSILYLTLENHDIANASNIASIIQQVCIGLGIVFAVGGFHFLLSLSNVLSMTDISNKFNLICTLLSIVMALNIFIDVYFNIYNK